MKRTALLRKTPLRRGGRIKAKSPRRIARETPAEKYWKGPWIHSRRCVGLRSFTDHVCVMVGGRQIEQMHLRDMTGLGLKASNFQSIPACHGLNYAYDNADRPPFIEMGKTGRKSWFYARLIEERADFVREHGCEPEDWTP